MKKSLKQPLIYFIFALFFAFSVNSYSQSASEIEEVENKINGIMDFPINTEGPNLEYTHLWFKQMLGGFIFAPWSAMGGGEGLDNGNYDINDQTVLAKALGFTNILAIIICLVIGYYLIVGGAINTAAKGEVLGQNWDGPWLAIRTSIGFGMLIPLKGIGGLTLSFSQIAVIWLIMIGSNAATLLWNMIGESIVSGTEIVSPAMNPKYNEVAALAAMVACADLHVQNLTPAYNKPDRRQRGSGNGRSNKSLDYAENRARTLVTIEYSNGRSIPMYAEKSGSLPAISRASSFWGSEQKIRKSEGEISSIIFGPRTGESCGILNFPAKGSDQTASKGNDWEETTATKYKVQARIAGGQAYADIVIDTANSLADLMRIMHPLDSEDDKYYSQNVKEALGDPAKMTEKEYDLFNEFHKEFISISEEYVKRVNEDIHKASVGNPAFVNKVKNKMLYGGWASAGIWFIELSTIPAIPYQAYHNVRKDLVLKSVETCHPVDKREICQTISAENGAYGFILSESLSRATGSDEGMTSSKSAQSVCGSSGSCPSPDEISSRFGVSAAKVVLDLFGSNDEESVSPFDNEESLVSPFLFLAEMGQTMNELAYSLIGGVVLMNAVMDYTEGIKQYGGKTFFGIAADLTGASLATHLIFGFFTSFAKSAALAAMGGLLAAAVAAMGSGFILAYVIPFMPITTWILMMAGYMLTVVEAIAAAPLAIVLLFTPEGSGIAGSRFERALNLVAMSILRPSFMILGLIAAITVSFVSFTMMNTFFFKTAEHVLTGHLFDTIAVILIYVSTAHQLAKMMVENMHQLPDRIGEWFAGGVSRQFGESRVNDSAERSVTEAAGQFKGMPSSIMGMQSAMRDAKNAEQSAESLEKKADKS